MSWAEVKKINSDLSKPLNELINELNDEEVALLNSIISKVDNTTYGLSAIKTVLDNVNNKVENSSIVGGYFEAGKAKLIKTISSTTSTVTGNTNTACGKFISPLSGTITISIVASSSTNSNLFFLKKGYTLEGTITIGNATSASYGKVENILTYDPVILSTSTNSYDFNVDVEQGKEYTIYFANSTTSPTVKIYSITAYANIISI